MYVWLIVKYRRNIASLGHWECFLLYYFVNYIIVYRLKNLEANINVFKPQVYITSAQVIWQLALTKAITLLLLLQAIWFHCQAWHHSISQRLQQQCVQCVWNPTIVAFCYKWKLSINPYIDKMLCLIILQSIYLVQ